MVLRSTEAFDPSQTHLYNVFSMSKYLERALITKRQAIVLQRHSMLIVPRRGLSPPSPVGDYYELRVRVGNVRQNKAYVHLNGGPLALPITNNELAHMIWLAEASRRAMLLGSWKPARAKGRRVKLHSKALDLIQSFRHKARAQASKPDE